jgi:hypothetical protein
LQFSFTRASAEQSASLLRDFEEPYTLTLPTERWTDGPYRLDVAATFEDGFTTSLTGMALSLNNGVSRMPVSTGGWDPYSVREGDENAVTVAAVGDGAGGLPGSYEVADLIEGWDPDMFLYLGDVYNVGSYTEFLNYYDPTFGRFKSITNPVPGDHEGGKNFQGYLDYWNSSQHFYAVTAGKWRLIGINSTERYGGLTAGTRQFEWLEAQLAANDDAGCTLVFLHDPRWRISSPDNADHLDELWSLLVREGVDIVLAGHEHRYERWQPLDADGELNQSAPVEFVVGTGGHELNPSRRTDPRVESAYSGDGALRLELRDGAADFSFASTANEVIDSGTVSCRGGDTGTESHASDQRATGTNAMRSAVPAPRPMPAAIQANDERARRQVCRPIRSACGGRQAVRVYEISRNDGIGRWPGLGRQALSAPRNTV